MVTKFINNKKVQPESWVTGPDNSLIPFDASLLLALDYPSIVRVIDVHQNDVVVQMVMEKVET